MTGIEDRKDQERRDRVERRGDDAAESAAPDDARVEAVLMATRAHCDASPDAVDTDIIRAALAADDAHQYKAGLEDAAKIMDKRALLNARMAKDLRVCDTTTGVPGKYDARKAEGREGAAAIRRMIDG